MIRAVVGAVALTVAAGCAHARPVPVPVTVLRAGAQCGGAAEGTSARWLPTEAALHQALAAEGSPDVQAPPVVDFTRSEVILVAMGRRATAGYGISLAEAGAIMRDGVATLVVKLDEPPPGAVLAQVTTSPCLLLSLPRAGLREVRVLDPRGTVLAVARAP